MPSIIFQSRVRTATENCTLTMIIEHCLRLGQPSDTPYRLKQPPPDALDILLASKCFVTISGSINNKQVSSATVMDSHITRHLLEYLRMNADDLGINTVANPAVFEETDMPTFSFTGSRPFPINIEFLPFHGSLAGFNVRYAWQTKSKLPSSATSEGELMEITMDPFSHNLPLTYLTMLNQTVERFITFQVVKRYPLVFGSWCKQLTLEAHFYPSIYASILNVMARSPHAEFSATCSKLLKLCRRRVEHATSNTIRTVADWLGSAETIELPLPALDDEHIFTSSMKTHYRFGMKRPRFKGMSMFCNSKQAGSASEAQLELGHDAEIIADACTNVSIKADIFHPLEQHSDACPVYSDDLDLSSDEIQSDCHPNLLPATRLELPQLASIPCDFWLSDEMSSDLDLDDDIYGFPNRFPCPVRLEFHPCIDEEEQGTPQEVKPEALQSWHDASMASSQCDWSGDSLASHEKANGLSMGVVSRPNSPDFAEINPGTFHDPIAVDSIEIRQGQNYVGGASFFDSELDNFSGSESLDDHGIINFKDELASISLAPGHQNEQNWPSTSFKDKPYSKRPHQKAKNVYLGVEHHALSDNLTPTVIGDVQAFLVMDLD